MPIKSGDLVYDSSQRQQAEVYDIYHNLQVARVIYKNKPGVRIAEIRNLTKIVKNSEVEVGDIVKLIDPLPKHRLNELCIDLHHANILACRRLTVKSVKRYKDDGILFLQVTDSSYVWPAEAFEIVEKVVTSKSSRNRFDLILDED